MRGDGRLYREPGSRFWWMAYYVHGRYVRQSTEETDEQKARRVLRKHIAAVLHGDVVANERRVTLGDLLQGLETDYTIQGRRSAGTIQYPLQHLRDYFAPGTRAVAISTDRLEQYIAHRLAEAAAPASIRIELALLGKAFTLAVRARRLRAKPFIPKPGRAALLALHVHRGRDRGADLVAEAPQDAPRDYPVLAPSRRRRRRDVPLLLGVTGGRGAYTRVAGLLPHREHDLASSRALKEQARPSPPNRRRARGRHGASAQGTPARCPYIFHQHGRPIGDFRTVWQTACKAIGQHRIIHDLSRSGVRHLIHAGVDPHTVMAFSGHRTDSMLKRYHIIVLDDLRRAAERASSYTEAETGGRVVALPARTRRVNPFWACVLR